MPLRSPAGFISAFFDPLKNPNAPTIGTATAGDASASVAFTAPSNVGGSAISSYSALSTPGGIVASAASSPVTVSGLTNGTAYTFAVWANNTYGPSVFSASSNSATPVAPSITWSTPTVFYSGDTTRPLGISLQDSGKVAVIYQDESSGGPNDLTRCVIGTISGTSISFGTPVTVNSFSIASDAYGIGYDTANSRIIWAYRNSSGSTNDEYGCAKAASVSGTVPTWGSEYVFNSGLTRAIALAYSTSASKFVVSYQSNPNSFDGRSNVGTISGTAISFGSVATFDSGSITTVASCYDSTNNAIGVMYNDVSTGYCQVVKGTISGTSISYSAASTFASSVASQAQFSNQLVFNSTEGKAVGLYWDYTPSNGFQTATISFAGTTPVIGTKVTTSGPDLQTMTSVSGSNFVAAGYNNSSPVGYSTRKGTISGSTVSYATTELIGNNAGSGYVFYDSVSGKVVYVYRGPSNYGYAVVGTIN